MKPAKFGFRSEIEFHDHVNGRSAKLPVAAAGSGHGGGDYGVLRAFAAAVRGDTSSITPTHEVMESHWLALAAEQSRLSGYPVTLDSFHASH